MFILEVCRALEAANVPYAIVGGYAVSLHGAVRGTVDVDIVLKWSLEHLQEAEKALQGLGLVSRLPINAQNVFENRRDFIENRNLIAWNFYHPRNLMQQVDIIVDFDLSLAKTTRVQTHLGSFPILALDDLIAMKKKSGRPQDLEDIKALNNL